MVRLKPPRGLRSASVQIARSSPTNRSSRIMLYYRFARRTEKWGVTSLVSEPSSWTIETTTLTDACVYPVNVCLRALCCMGLFKTFCSFCFCFGPPPPPSRQVRYLPARCVFFYCFVCLVLLVFSLVALTGFLDGRVRSVVWAV